MEEERDKQPLFLAGEGGRWWQQVSQQVRNWAWRLAVSLWGDQGALHPQLGLWGRYFRKLSQNQLEGLHCSKPISVLGYFRQ